MRRVSEEEAQAIGLLRLTPSQGRSSPSEWLSDPKGLRGQVMAHAVLAEGLRPAFPGKELRRRRQS